MRDRVDRWSLVDAVSMSDFVLDKGRLVRWKRRPVIEEVSFLILLAPPVVIVGLLVAKGRLTVRDIGEFLSGQNQFKMTMFALVIAFLVLRLVFYTGNWVVFDREHDEVRRIRQFRLGLRWVELWRASDITSLAAIPYGHASWNMAVVVARCRNGDSFTVGEPTDRASADLTADRIRRYLDGTGG